MCTSYKHEATLLKLALQPKNSIVLLAEEPETDVAVTVAPQMDSVHMCCKKIIFVSSFPGPSIMRLTF